LALESGHRIVIYSEMGEGGVVFADGIEGGNVEFMGGNMVSIGVAHDILNLVVPTTGWISGKD
jgi:hypothetical protein